MNYSSVQISGKLSKGSEMNITGTLPPLLFMAKTWSQILRVTSPRHACLGEVSRESASRQSHVLSMRSDAYDKLVFVQCEKCFFGLKASDISGLIRTQWSEIRFVLMIIWKCGIKSPKRPKVSSKYCDYFNKVSVFKYLNICLWLSEYLSLNICLSLFTKTLEVFWSIFDSFRPAYYTH